MNNRRPSTVSILECARKKQESKVENIKFLKDVPFEQRRKEASEPLYLVRYE
jgi:hypothetical protein